MDLKLVDLKNTRLVCGARTALLYGSTKKVPRGDDALGEIQQKKMTFFARQLRIFRDWTSIIRAGLPRKRASIALTFLLRRVFLWKELVCRPSYAKAALAAG